MLALLVQRRGLPQHLAEAEANFARRVPRKRDPWNSFLSGCLYAVPYLGDVLNQEPSCFFAARLPRRVPIGMSLWGAHFPSDSLTPGP